MIAPGELVGVSCDVDVHGSPCYLWTGHYGLHVAEGHDSYCKDCGGCICGPSDDCWVEDVGEDRMVAVRLPRHTFVRDVRAADKEGEG
jgi:hypothetical protein